MSSPELIAFRKPADSAPRLIASLVPASASGEMSAIRRANLSVAVASSALGTTRFTIPYWSAVCASIGSPRNRSSRARLSPMTKGMTSAGPTFEKRISGSPNSASSAAIVRSHIIASSQPPPRQCPWTEAITGFFISHGVISSATSSVSDSCHASALPRRAARAGLGEMS